MILLTSTGDLLKVVTGSALNTDVHASWVDNAAGVITPGRTNTAITTATTTTAVASPGASTQRNVVSLTVRNKDAAASQAVTVQQYDGTITVDLVKVTLLAGESLVYSGDNGFQVLDASGSVKLSVVSTSSFTVDRFSGNGSTAAFSLTATPGIVANVFAYVDGVYQQKNTYSVSGSTITFDAAPPTGTNNIEVMTVTAITTTSVADGAVTLTKLGALTTKGDILTHTGSAHVRQGVGTDGQGIRADSSQTNGIIWTDYYDKPNLLVNPNWNIDQINEGALYTVNATGVQGPDGVSGDAVGTGVFKLRTIADPDNAALKCLEISCTTADAAIANTDRYEVWWAVEGYDAAALQFGLASGVPFTYQFGLKSNSVTGVFGVYFTNSAGNRFYAGTITIPDTAAHEYSLTLTPDAAGTWLYTNGIGLRIGLVLAAGTDFQGTAGAWTASTVRTTAAQANFMSANTNILYVKRRQLIPGTLVQAYRPADIQKELAKAQRYYEKSYDIGTAVGTVTNNGAQSVLASFNGANAFICNYTYKVTKRTAPSPVGYSPATGASGSVRNITAVGDTGANVGTNGVMGGYFLASSTAADQQAYWHWVANVRLS